MLLRLISAKLCPFAQRNLIVFRAKGVDVDVVWVDLFDKPAWLLKLSPSGKVPLLEVDGEVLAESNVISEFLEELFLRPHLHPETPVRRAQSRMWIEVVSPLAMEVHRVMMAPDEATVAEGVQTIRQRLVTLAPAIAGPLFTGEELSLVDVAAAPALLRLAWCAKLDPSTNAAAGLPAVERWQAALLAHEAVSASIPDGLYSLWLEFLKGGASPKRKAPASWLGMRAEAQVPPTC